MSPKKMKNSEKERVICKIRFKYVVVFKKRNRILSSDPLNVNLLRKSTLSIYSYYQRN